MSSDAGAAPAPAAAASSVADVLAADDSWHTSVEMSLAWLLLAMAVLATYFIQRLRIGAHLPPSAVAMCIGIAVGGVLLALPGPQQQLVFEPEFFFFGLLPPVIFNAGFQLKKKGFIRNIFPILMFAVLGTIISALVFGFGIFGLAAAGLVRRQNLGINPIFDCLLYGSLISATDPVATLTILQDLSAPPQLYNLVFGESVLNDAIAIVLFKTISKYYTSDAGDEAARGGGWSAAWAVLIKFVAVSLGSIVIGFGTALLGALILKRLMLRRQVALRATEAGAPAMPAAPGASPPPDEHEHPNPIVYELAILVLFAYFAYSFAEVFGFSGIMSLFFAGATHGHYSFYNLSHESQVASRHVFEVISFLSETFIFVYLGLQLPTLRHTFDPGLIVGGIALSVLSRACNIFPLSAVINAAYGLRACARPRGCGGCCPPRPKKRPAAAAVADVRAAALGPPEQSMTKTLIPWRSPEPAARRDRTIALRVQLVMWACGLRGAIAYALAINLPDKALSMLKRHRRHRRGAVVVDAADGVGVPAIETATLIIVIFTTIVFGLLTGPLLRLLGMQGGAGAGGEDDEEGGGARGGGDLQMYGEEDDPEGEYFRDEGGPAALQRTGSKEMWEWWRSFDRRYMKRVFGGSAEPASAGGGGDGLEMNAAAGAPPPVAEYFGGAPLRVPRE